MKTKVTLTKAAEKTETIFNGDELLIGYTQDGVEFHRAYRMAQQVLNNVLYDMVCEFKGREICFKFTELGEVAVGSFLDLAHKFFEGCEIMAVKIERHKDYLLLQTGWGEPDNMKYLHAEVLVDANIKAAE